MKKITMLTLALLVVACVATVSSCNNSIAEPALTVISKDSIIKKGAYLVTIAGCNDCHTPKIMTARGPALDSARLLSGHRSDAPFKQPVKDAMNKGWALFEMDGTSLVSPLGISYSANISSDATGIGGWSYEQFKTAMTEGKYKGQKNGRPLLPPMPWENYKKMTDDDIRSIFAYLQSTKPVNNIVPQALLFATKQH